MTLWQIKCDGRETLRRNIISDLLYFSSQTYILSGLRDVIIRRLVRMSPMDAHDGMVFHTDKRGAPEFGAASGAHPFGIPIRIFIHKEISVFV